MSNVFQTLLSVLDDREVSYDTPGAGAVCMDLLGGNARYRVIVMVEEDNIIEVTALCPILTPKGAIPAVAEALHRANDGLRVGKFEFDCDKGGIKFSVTQIITPDLDESVIDRMISTTLHMFAMYLPAVMAVIYGNEVPKEAIKCVEVAEGGRSADWEGE